MRKKVHFIKDRGSCTVSELRIRWCKCSGQSYTAICPKH